MRERAGERARIESPEHGLLYITLLSFTYCAGQGVSGSTIKMEDSTRLLSRAINAPEEFIIMAGGMISFFRPFDSPHSRNGRNRKIIEINDRIDDNGFVRWRASMRITLRFKNKLGLINRTYYLFESRASLGGIEMNQ